ncbi:MAG TPA: DJ-1/PfpI family protein [Candidatus Dormibacteraeota bacterium]
MSINVGIYIWPNMTMLDSLGPHQVLGLMPEVDVYTFARTTETFTTDTRMRIAADYGFSDMPQPDVLIVGGGANPLAEMADSEVIEAIRTAGAGARTVTSVCTGALILAEAGLLDGYRATTHWAYRDLLRQYDRVEVVEGRVVADRDRVTSGGITAGLDFAITLIARELGDDTACMAELLLEYDPQPPYRTGSPQTAPAPLVEMGRGVIAQMSAGLPEFVASRRSAVR